MMLSSLCCWRSAARPVVADILCRTNRRLFASVSGLSRPFPNAIDPRNRADSPSREGTCFELSDAFVESYRERPSQFGFNGLGEIVFYRTYSRLKDDGRNEMWHETVERVVNGTFSMQKEWIESQRLQWDDRKARSSAEEMFDRIFNHKFLPPGRGLWAMGSPLTRSKRLYAALNNCAFVSTNWDDISSDPAKPFCFLMDMSMLGVGVGFDTHGASRMFVYDNSMEDGDTETYVIPDCREGWVSALHKLISAYLWKGHRPVDFDFSAIRPAGEAIRGFGGVASGPGALKSLLGDVRSLLESVKGSAMTQTHIVDVMNLIGRCVVAGNVRQTAEIAFGDVSEEYLNLKNYNVNPHRAAFGWASNNSVFATVGMDYTEVCERVRENGEPGFAWLENMRNYSRMQGSPDFKDSRAAGGNPCLEQTLESFELCCLVETFPDKHESIEDYKRTLKYAYLYAKTVTLGRTHWEESNKVMLRNRRIGCSMSGIAQFVSRRGMAELRRWCESGYAAIQENDTRLSEWFAVPKSIKTTSIKPSGTVSLLAGATPGMHWPESRHYIRRVRLSSSSELLVSLREAGYRIELAKDQPNSSVVEIPVDVGEGIRTVPEVSMWEQLALAAFLQKHWSDNQVSCTVSFEPDTEGHQLAPALDYYQFQLKGISFLPRIKLGAFEQMPYEAIDHNEYERRVAELKPLHFAHDLRGDEAVPDKFCDGDVCGVDSKPVLPAEKPL